MRYQYSSYIMQQLASSAVVITVGLTGIIWLTQALRYIDFIVNRGVSIGDFVFITALLVPSLLMLILPVALFIAALFTYHKLIMDSELVVLRSAGLSHWQLARPAIAVAVLATALCYVISLYLLPLSSRQFQDMRSFISDNYASVLLQEEVFNNPVDGLTVFIRERDSEGNLKGILVHDDRLATSPVTMMAEEGKLLRSKNGPQFYLERGIRQEMRDGRISWLNFDSYNLDISFYTNEVRARTRDPNEHYMRELFDRTAASNDKERARLRAEGHQRLGWPLYCLTLTMFAVAVLVSGEFNRRGLWRRMALMSLVVTTSVVGTMGLRNTIVSAPELVPLFYVNVLSLAAIAIWLFSATSKRICSLKQPVALEAS